MAELNFATIVTSSFIPYARTLARSIRRHTNQTVRLHCLVVDSSQDSKENDGSSLDELVIHSLLDLQGDLVTSAQSRYSGSSVDCFRWTLKPIFVMHLLKKTSATGICFIDPDEYFTSSATVLFDYLQNSRFVLSPHDRPINPDSGQIFFDQLTDGLFNGGLFLARNDSLDILDWWAKACVFRCEVNRNLGLFVDQKYLDLVPTNFEGVTWTRHRGVNVASWNMLTRKRSVDEHGKILIDGQPLVCVHFSGSTIRLIDNGADWMLQPVLKAYRQELSSFGITLQTPAAKKPSEKIKNRDSGRTWFERVKSRLITLRTGK